VGLIALPQRRFGLCHATTPRFWFSGMEEARRFGQPLTSTASNAAASSVEVIVESDALLPKDPALYRPYL